MSMTTVLILIAVLAAVVLVASKGGGKKKRTASGPRSFWRFDRWSKGTTLHTVGNGCRFDFPARGAGSVGYVQLVNPPPLGDRITLRFTVTGGGFVPEQFPDRPATVCLVIQRKGDDWSAAGPMAAFRWYSKEVLELTPGEHELSIPLDVSAWGDVNNGQDPEAFAAALRDIESYGVAIGSDGGRGHGVFATTPSRFTLL